jgi:[citrate (pro-3S)-lyase] ligase
MKTLGAVGAIVVNGNPFTHGQRYLIKYASRRVKHLYIFVAEENNAIFPLTDRLNLVKAGTKGLPEITVLPLTDTITTFAEVIAPILGITVRFAGEEPFDTLANQYNATMRRILPQYGIDFEVIARKKAGGVPISALRVRKLLYEENYKELVKLVPDTTLRYLRERVTGT